MLWGQYFPGPTIPKSLAVVGKMLSFLALLCVALILARPVQAQTVNQYTINEPGGSNDIVAARTCGTGTGGTGGSPLVKNFTVATNFVVADVDLGVLASHGYRTDIRVVLQSPAGTRAILIAGATSGGNNNLNVQLSDESSPAVNSGGHGNDSLTPTPNPPTTAYQRQLSPNNPLSVFDGQNSIGTWRMELCDMYPSADDGNFLRADLWLTQQPSNFADLSLTKTVNNATPANGSNITYTLQLNNSAASNQTANNVTVRDILPAGTTFVSASGYGTYNSGTGIWTLPNIAPNQTRSLTIVATVNATAGATVTNIAEVTFSDRVDPDSTPNNGITAEDDYASRSFTVSGTRVAGTPPSLGTICSPANQITFDWQGRAWPTGDVNEDETQAGIGSINFAISSDVAFVTGSPTINTTNTGGFGATEEGLFINNNNNSQSDEATVVISLPTAVPGAQFRVFDIDFGSGSFADKLTVTGSFNGSAVMPTLTNGTANYVVGNVAIGDVPSNGPDPDGNVVVTFLAPVDTITIKYGNHTTAPADPGNQFMTVHDITMCRPITTMSVTKISSIISDPVNGTTNPKRIPGAIVEYCILISNSGSASAASIVATDNLISSLSYTAGTMRSGSNCGSAATVEDDNNIGADESDPYGASISGSTITATAANLGPASSFALTFQTTVN